MKHTCPHCHKEFEGRASRKYCSRSCARSATPGWNKGMTGLPSTRPKTGGNRICQHCGQEFYAHKASRAKYCDKTCYHAHRWGTTGACPNCGKATRTKFCSSECQAEFWNKNDYHLNKKHRNWERKKEIIAALGGKCVRCGIDDIRVLDINHKDPERKERHKHYTWSRRLKDWSSNLENMELLCANCHRIHTWEQMNYGIVNGKRI